MPEPMETLHEAVTRLRAAGYDQDWFADDGRLRCGTCGTVHDPASVTIDDVVRFEGPSDPGDEAVLFALSADCSHRGLYSVAYGPDTPPGDVEVIRALPPH